MNGRFKPGKSGNEYGRPKGSSDKRTTWVRELEGDVPAFITKLKEKALEGDLMALRLVFDRVVPQRKPSHDPVEIPELLEAKTLTDKVDAILSCVARAQLPPDVGSQLIGAIGVAARVEEVSVLKERLEALELSLERGKQT